VTRSEKTKNWQIKNLLLHHIGADKPLRASDIEVSSYDDDRMVVTCSKFDIYRIKGFQLADP
jgi:hypothetical protein